MTGYLLDTDICSYFAKGKPELVRRMLARDWIISSLTVYEIRKGILAKGPGAWAQNVEDLLAISRIVDFDSQAASRAAEVSALLRRTGAPSGVIDELLAGQALSLGLVLVTNNTKHFHGIPGLKLENWA